MYNMIKPDLPCEAASDIACRLSLSEVSGDVSIRGRPDRRALRAFVRRILAERVWLFCWLSATEQVNGPVIKERVNDCLPQ